MKALKTYFRNWGQRLLKTTLIAILLIPLSIGLSGAWWDGGSEASSTPRKSQLAQGDAITDPSALLRYALPIDNPEVRKLQGSLEEMSAFLRTRRWTAVSRNVKEARRVLSNPDKLLASIPSEQQPQAQTLLEQLDRGIEQLYSAIEAEDKDAVWSERGQLLGTIGELEALMVQGFPFAVPEEYANLPQLKGRATVEIETNKGNLTVVADGYSAPVNAGNFIDLVERGFYDGLEFMPSQDYVLQVGDPPGDEVGFTDPNTGEYRAIPLEVLIAGEKEPMYGITLEDAGFYLEPVALPFSAYGALALARPGSDPNGGSSQIFFFLFDRELTPPGYNLLDGRYSVFGYVVEGKEVLEKLKSGDRILSAEVVAGSENLVQPKV